MVGASGDQDGMSFRQAVLKLLASASTEWMVRRGAPAPPPPLSLEQRQQIQEAFEMLDADGSGELGVDELQEAYHLLGMPLTRAQAQAMLDEVDADGSGQIEFDEFRSLMGRAILDPESAAAQGGGPLLSIGDMAKAYRRKKMLDSVVAGGEARKKLVAMYETRL